MTTKITVDAHAGWPVAVTAIDSFGNTVTESLVATVPPGGKQDFYITNTREIRCVELGRPDALAPLAKPLDFGSVVRGLKAGKRFARVGWNGKGMFVFLVPGSHFTVNREPLLSILGEGAKVDYCAHIDIRRVDGSIATWAPSNGDTLAEDWYEVLPE